MRRTYLSEEDWLRIQPLLPSNEGQRGRNYRDHRQVIEGILWRLRTGAAWRDLPLSCGPWKTVYDRFRRWTQSGVWKKLARMLRRLWDRTGKLDWSAHFVDGTVVPAHHQAATGRLEEDKVGVSRGGLTTRVHVRLDRDGHLMGLEVTEGQRQEKAVFEDLMNQGDVPQPRGRPRRRPEAIVGDKGYNAGWIRAWSHQRDMAAVIPKFSSQDRRGPFQEDLYQERSQIECWIGRFKQFRALCHRFEKRPDHFEANWRIAWIFETVTDLDNDIELSDAA